jgi:nicotinamidase/pyrazinamidase
MPPLSPEPDDLVVQKGVDAVAPGYSAFEATGLDERLRSRQVTEVAVCGIATEFCVRATALDAAGAGFLTMVLTDLVRAVCPAEVGDVFDELTDAGVRLIRSVDWSATEQA